MIVCWPAAMPPLALCWKGEGLTNLGNSIKDQDTEIILSSGNPTKVYVLNTNDMKVKTEITYNGEGEFHPNYVIYPYGVQNSLWEGELYWLGGGPHPRRICCALCGWRHAAALDMETSR